MATPGIDFATLAAALVSAGAALAAAVTARNTLRLQAQPPRVQVGWRATGMVVTVRNVASIKRTVHTIGFVYRSGASTNHIFFDNPELYGPALPHTIPAKQRTEWHVPYGQVRAVKKKYMSRWNPSRFKVEVDLGDVWVVTRIPYGVRRRVRPAAPEQPTA